MKTFLRGIRRYLLSAFLIILLILISNVAIFFYIIYTRAENSGATGAALRQTMETVGQEIASNPVHTLSEEGKKELKDCGFVWAMTLDEEGNVVWDWRLPDDLPRQYGLSDVASFSRWYLEDYPVRVWGVKDLLLVCAQSPEEVSMYSVPMSVRQIESLPRLTQLFVAVNLAVILLFVLIFGWKFYASVKPISDGIEKLSRKEPVHLKEKGAVRELAEKINQTSRLLSEQEEKLSRRDQARSDWIAGVSHDIRTPLTLIVGYAERLAEDSSLGRQEQEMAAAIGRQSGLIRQLIENLNLTSKLSYDTFPLHLSDCSPAGVLRECVADLYNQGLQPEYSIELTVTEAAEKIRVEADVPLMKRAIHNVIGNSIRHNPEGCQISVRLTCDGQRLHYVFRDSGPGIPDEIVACLEAEEEDEKTTHKDSTRRDAVNMPHIMGMRLTKQIVELHGGKVFYYKRKNGNYDCGFVIG